MTVAESPPSRPPLARKSSSGWARFGRLALKELRETLRDRRTIVTLLLMPVLVYPILGVALQQFALSGTAAGGNEIIWRIAAENDDDARLLRSMLYEGDVAFRKQPQTPALPTAAAAQGDADAATSPTDDEVEPSIEILSGPNLDQLLLNLEIDVAVRRQSSDEAKAPEAVTWELSYRANMPLSRQVAEFVESRLRAYNEVKLRERLGVRDGAELAVGWTWKPLAEKTESKFPFASLAPMVLILMTITGAVYPAIDLTAGERERGTLEALMAAPVPRLSLLAAKYVAVLTVALLTAVANLVAMSITLRGTGLGEAFLGPDGMSIQVILAIFMLLGLFAAFFSAVLLAITSFARSFKEAQAYLIPLMLLSLGPGFVSVIPGLKLQGILAVAPLVNIVLLARDVMQGTAEALPAAVAILSTALYAIAALALAARIFGSDSVLYGSQGSWSDLLRQPDQPQPVATPSAAWLTAAIVYPLYFTATGLLSAFREAPMRTQIIMAGLSTVTVFALVPWLAASRQRVRLVSGFQLFAPPLLSLVGAVLLGFSLWVLAHEVFVLSAQLGLGKFSPDVVQEFAPLVEQRLQGWRSLSPALVLAAFALAPALCEEFFFRGYLMGALRRRWPAWSVIGATAILFGVFHLSVGGLAAVERVITSTFLGLVLGVMCWRTGSIWPGVLTHTLHNGLVLSLGIWKDKLPQYEVASLSGHLPPLWIGMAAIAAGLGLALVYWSGRAASERNEPSSTNTPARAS